MISTYVYDTSLTELEKEIESKSSQGLSLVDIDYADLGDGKGEWIGEFESLPDENTVLVFNKNYDIFLEDMKQKIQQGYKLIDLEQNNGYTSAVLSDSSENKGFNGSTNLDTFTGQIKQRWSQDYHLRNVEYTDGTWFGFYSPSSVLEANAYFYSTNLDTFTGQIQQLRSQDYDLVNVEYGDGNWFGVFEKTSQLSRYSYSPNLHHFHETRKNYAENGYYLTDLELDNNQGIFGVYQTVYKTNSSSSITDFSSFITVGQNYIEQSTEGLYQYFMGADITSSNITTNNLLFRNTFI